MNKGQCSRSTVKLKPHKNVKNISQKKVAQNLLVEVSV